MRKYWLLLIIAAAFILRIYKAPERFFWQVDEDIIGLTVKKILINLDPQMIGFPIPGGLFIGPAFYYLVALPYLLVRMNPEGLPFIAAIIGTLTTFLVYRIGKIIFEKESVGLAAAIIYGFSFLVNTYSRVLTGLTLAPILSLFVYLILYQNLKFKKPKNLLWLGLLLALSTQNEGSSLSLLGLTGIVWLIYRFPVPAKKLLKIIFILALFQLPLLIFDLKHNFFLVKSNALFFLKRTTILKNISPETPLFNFDWVISTLEFFPQTLARFFFVSGQKDIAAQILPCPELVSTRLSQIPIWTYILVLIIIGFFILSQVFQRKIVLGARIIFIHLMVMICGIISYNFFMPKYFFEWITVIFFPGFALMTGYFLDNVYRKNLIGKTLVFVFLLFFALYNLRTTLVASSHFGLETKVKAVKFALRETGGQPFYLESLGSCYAQGYLYLFWYYGQLPTHSFGIGAYFTPTLIPEPAGPKPNLGVVLVNPSQNETEEFWRKYNFYQTKKVLSQKFGDIEVLIVEDGSPFI